MVLLLTRGDEALKPASQQWVESVQTILVDIGWPGGLGELLLLALGIALFLLQFLIYVKRAFFSDSGRKAMGRIIEVGERFDRHAKAEIAYRIRDGREFTISDRGAYRPEDVGGAVPVLYADLNPQRAYVYRPNSGALRQFLIGGALAAACAVYGFLPVLNAAAGG